MIAMDSGSLALIGITLVAAFVNGALGYGFSSLTVPVALRKVGRMRSTSSLHGERSCGTRVAVP